MKEQRGQRDPRANGAVCRQAHKNVTEIREAPLSQEEWQSNKNWIH